MPRHPEEHRLLRNSGRSQRSRNIIRRLLERDGEQCAYCGRPFSQKFRMTIDHRVPRAKGGLTQLPNLCLACNSCNNLKADRDEAEFRSNPFGI